MRKLTVLPLTAVPLIIFLNHLKLLCYSILGTCNYDRIYSTAYSFVERKKNSGTAELQCWAYLYLLVKGDLRLSLRFFDNCVSNFLYNFSVCNFTLWHPTSNFTAFCVLWSKKSPKKLVQLYFSVIENYYSVSQNG